MVFRPISLVVLALTASVALAPVISVIPEVMSPAPAQAASLLKFKYERRTLAHGGAEMPVGTKFFGDFYRFDYGDELSFAMSHGGVVSGNYDSAAVAKIDSLYRGDRVDKVTLVYSDPHGAMYEAQGYLRNRKRNFRTRVLATEGQMWIAASSVKPTAATKYKADVNHYLKTFGFYAD